MVFFSSGKDDSPTLKWEYLQSAEGGPGIIHRTKVPGGWLISMDTLRGGGITFLPDPLHEWDGTSL